MTLARFGHKTIAVIALLLLCSAGGVLAVAQSPRSLPNNAEVADLPRGTTVPSATVELGLNIPRVVREVPVKPGDQVKAGDLLLAQEDHDEVVRLEILKHKAETNIPIDAALVELEQKEVNLRRMEQMAANRVANALELEEAVVEVKIAKLKLAQARDEKREAELEVKRQEELLKQMRILSPFDGIVHDTPVLKGEVVDPQKPAIVMVRIDPLWVHVHLPSAKTRNMKVGQEIGVVYPGDDRSPVTGKIIYLDPVVDATADMRLVRLELPNAELRPAGLRIHVVLPKEAATAAAR